MKALIDDPIALRDRLLSPFADPAGFGLPDYRALPSGSDNQKGVLSQTKRMNVAWLRAKKVKQANEESGGEAESLPEDDGQASIREAVRWVLTNLGDGKARPPSRLARSIQRYAKENEQGFMDKYVPVLMRGEKDEERPKTVEERIKVSVGEAQAAVREYLEEFRRSRGVVSQSREDVTKES